MSRTSARRGIGRSSVVGGILLVAVLLFLVPPAIQSSREAARREGCSNNLREIVTGLASYHDVHKMFPMGAMHAGPNPGGDPPVTAALGPAWWFGLLPLMDQRGGPKVRVTTGPKGTVCSSTQTSRCTTRSWNRSGPANPCDASSVQMTSSVICRQIHTPSGTGSTWGICRLELCTRSTCDARPAPCRSAKTVGVRSCSRVTSALRVAATSLRSHWTTKSTASPVPD